MIYKKLYLLIAPKSKNPDDRRREFILNILLTSAICLLVISVLTASLKKILFFRNPEDVISLLFLYVVLSVFLILYFLSRRGYFTVSSFVFVGMYFVIAAYMVFLWGIEVQAPLLFFAMAIVLSGVLISSRFSLLAVAISSSILSIFYYLQQKNILHPSLGWKNDPWGWIEITVVSVIFFIIAIVSWLSNREIEKSLERARKSESDLKKERDQLEIKVEARTKELKEMQAEKMSQVYRLAELGRLSSGLFHDLMNPLNAVHLNIEGARNQDSCNDSMLSETKAYLDRAMSAAKKMEDFIKAVRKQIIKQDDKAVFSPIEEIKQVIEVLLYKARKAKVELNFSYPEDVQILGNATKFNQVALNLISNAIESYANLPESSAEKQSVSVSLREEDNNILMSVEDHGEGILKKNLGKIFEPFFTTKGSLGMGIGLSTVKKIVQDDFGGKIEVESKKNKGTIFKIVIPKK